MKILLLGSYPPDRLLSIERCESLLTEAFAGDSGIQVELLCPRAICNHSLRPYAGLPKWLGYLDTYILVLPRLVSALRRSDVLHISDQGVALHLLLPLRFFARLGLKKAALKTSVTVHDLIAIRKARGEFNEPTGAMGKLLQRLNAAGLAQADYLTFDSEETKKDYLRLISSSQPGVLIPNTLEPKFLNYEKTTTQRESFFLHVGAGAWYKNRSYLLRLFAELVDFSEFKEFRLKLVGPELEPELLEEAKKLRVLERIDTETDIAEERISELYSKASALLFPSLVEGFGWPPLEALCFSTPVFVSEMVPTFLPEAMGLIELDSAADAATKIKIELLNTELQAKRCGHFREVRSRYSLESFKKSYEDFFKGMFT